MAQPTASCSTTTTRRRSPDRGAARRRASLTAAALWLFTWMALSAGLAAGHTAAGWTGICTGNGVTTVLLDDSGSGTDHRNGRHCTLCWGQAPAPDMPALAASPEPLALVPVADVPPAPETVIPRALFRFQTRSRAPPTSADAA